MSIIKSMLLNDLKRTEEAVAELEIALHIAAEYGYIRPFADFGKELLPLINLIYNSKKGKKDLSSEHIIKILSSFSYLSKKESVKTEHFSEREIQVIKLMEKGLSHSEISTILSLSINTVKTHLRNVYSKLNAKNRIDAISKARTLAIFDK